MRPGQIRLLDTDVMIDLQRKHPAALAWYQSVPPGMLGIPGHALMELYQDAENMRQNIIVDRLTSGLPIVWPTDTEALQAVANFRLLHLFRAIPGLVTEQPYTR